jgi:hypothetical protein
MGEYKEGEHRIWTEEDQGNFILSFLPFLWKVSIDPVSEW